MGVFWIARSTPKTPRYLIGDASNRVASIFPAVSAETVRQWEQSSGNEAMTLTTAYEYDAYGNITRLTETGGESLTLTISYANDLNLVNLYKVAPCYPKNRPPQSLGKIRDISNGNPPFSVPDFQPITAISASFMTDFPKNPEIHQVVNPDGHTYTMFGK